MAKILQAGLEAHERLELELGSPIADFCERIELDPLAVPMEHVGTTLFLAMALADEPLTRKQTALQNAILDALPRAARTLYRQLRTQPLRAWRYRAQRGSRDVASQLAGPAAGQEELFDGFVDILSRRKIAPGEALTCVGWPVSANNGAHLLIAGGILTRDAERRIEACTPFPMPTSESVFWADFESLLADAVDPLEVVRSPSAARLRQETVDTTRFRDGAQIVIHPTLGAAELLERVLVAADFRLKAGRGDWYRRALVRVRWSREVIANAQTGDDLAGLIEALGPLRFDLMGWSARSQFTSPTDSALDDYLPMERILAGFGVETDGAMIGAETGTLHLEPIERLRLDDHDPLFNDLHGREPIRAALAWARRAADADAARILAAFETFRAERRWCATFDPLDLSRDDHLDRIDYTVIQHGLETIFDPRILRETIESFDLDGRVFGWLEAALRERPFSPENALTIGHLPSTEEVVLSLRNLGRTSLRSLKRALLERARTWRGAAPIAGANVVEVDEGELGSGLDELASLFGD